MHTFHKSSRWVAGLVITALAVAVLSPAAHAGSGRRYKRAPSYCPPPVTRHVHHAPRVVYYERTSDAAPLFAGLIGGLVIGAALAHAAPAPPAHYYWDPWCGARFGSVAVYHSHFRHHHHPRVLRVISVESGNCLDTWRWHAGGWHSESGGYWGG